MSLWILNCKGIVNVIKVKIPLLFPCQINIKISISLHGIIIIIIYRTGAQYVLSCVEL